MGCRRVVQGVTAVITVAASLVAIRAGAAQAAPPASPAIEPVVSPQSGPNIWLYTSPPVSRAQTAAATAPSVPKGTGPVRNGTQLSFSLGDRLQAKVNVGSGNLLLTSTELTLPGTAENVALGASFNSLLLGSDIATGAYGKGWRTRSGIDVRLFPADDNSVTYAAADGVVGKFTADGSGYKTPAEFKASLKKDGSGWKLTEHDSGKVLFFGSDGLLNKSADRNHNVTQFDYAAGKLTKVTSDRGATTNLGSPRVAVVSYTDNKISKYRQTGTDGSWREATYAYDSSGRLQTIQTATPRKVMFDYNAAGDLTKITTKDDTFITITYDGQHRVTSLTQVTDNATGKGSTTRLAYTNASTTDVADPRQDLSQPVTAVPHTSYTLNDSKRVTKSTDPAGNERSKTYTAFSDVATSASPEGGSTTNSFDANGGESMTKSASPTGASASAAYANPASQTNPTANFQPSSSTNSQGNSSAYTYNGAGNKTSTKDALAAEAKVDYNDDGTVKTATDPANDNNPSRYTYQDKQLTKVTAPTGNALADKSFTYDVLGRLKTVTKGACVTTYGYDNEDRLLTTAYSGSGCPATSSVTFEYGATGNLIKRADATGVTTYEYDTLNRLRRRTAPGAVTQTYVPDPAGNLEQLTDGRGTTRYFYNTRNWLVRMDTAGGARYNFVYDKDGNRTHEYFATDETNSTWALHTETAYDKSDRPKRITATRNSAAAVKVFDVTYCYAKFVSGQPCSIDKDKDTGLRQWQKDEISGAVSQYDYDKGDRLTKASNHYGKTYDYDYDSNGNRKSVKVDSATTQTLTYNSANQITSADNAYDNRGNATKVSAPLIGTLGYNAAEQMTSTTAAAATNYAYAGTDQVELTTAGAVKLSYGMEEQHGMPWLQSWTNGANLPVYVERDGLGTPLGLRIGTTDYAFVLDGNGSPVAIIAANNTVAATYEYDPYGNTTKATETGLPQTNIIRYAGGTFDNASKLTKFGHRWYNPIQGRFTQQDNLSFIGNPQHGNRYAYAGANPVSFIDPTGLSPEGNDLEYVVGTTSNFAGAGGGIGAGIGCLAAVEAGCAPGAGAGAGIGAGIGAVAGLGYSLGRVCKSHNCLGLDD